MVLISDLKARSRGTVTGIVRSTVLTPRSHAPAFEAQISDGSGTLDAVWLGRRSIGGIEPGRAIVLDGVVTTFCGHRAMYNPAYQLIPKDGE